MPSIKRNILFFDVDLRIMDEDGTSAIEPANKAVIFEEALNSINRMPFSTQQNLNSRYYINTDGNMLYTNIININEFHIEGQFVLSRKRNFPDIETDGNLSPLVERIPANSGLAEISHFIYFKNSNIIGYESNFYAPRATALCYYVPIKSDMITTMNLTQKLNMDADRKLDETDEISFFDIAIGRNHLNLVRNMDENLYFALESAARMSDDAEVLEVVLRRRKRSRGKFSWLNLNKENIKTVLRDPDSRVALERLIIRSETLGKTIDLLQDKMVAEETLITTDDIQNRVLSDSAFDGIKRAYSNCFNNRGVILW